MIAIKHNAKNAIEILIEQGTKVTREHATVAKSKGDMSILKIIKVHYELHKEIDMDLSQGRNNRNKQAALGKSASYYINSARGEIPLESLLAKSASANKSHRNFKQQSSVQEESNSKIQRIT